MDLQAEIPDGHGDTVDSGPIPTQAKIIQDLRPIHEYHAPRQCRSENPLKKINQPLLPLLSPTA